MNHLPAPRSLSRKVLWAVPAVAAATALTVSACGSSTTAAKSSSAPSTTNGVNTVNVTLANDGGKDGCAADATSVPAGPVTFKVTNASAPGITEMELLKDQRIVGEKENLAPGLDPVSFTATLDGGQYRIYCPGASNEYLDLTVTGQAAAAPTGTVPTILASGTKEYSAYVVDQVNQLDSGVKALDAAIQAGKLNDAKAAYAQARPFYERAESSVDGFVLPGFAVDDNAGNLDYLIDMRESTPVDAKVGWKGFHAIERDLFQGNAITPTTKALSTELVGNVGRLVNVVAPLQFKPEDLANGAADLIEEVQNTKITGEEEAFSHIDLVDFAGNVEGAQQAYASLRPGLQKIDPALVATLDGQFQSVLTTLDGYRDPAALGGYRTWTPELRGTDAPKLTAVIQPLHESLATVAQKVVSAT
ncbi:iron uptake system protein EfeO [Mycolicibacterium madagascariense]|uniref:iron uptake system protein EfeO n=1 Tax=Mycolicibacterium madagascariense TaxID=212765 RepID=UPI0013D74592|nr:iron uptake system protein EfeO [Mycolicibacterium madagascariense]MCV7014080.1 EfeM/EfeO family lipoprotein [Mycolicibacterium madagascariense]